MRLIFDHNLLMYTSLSWFYQWHAQQTLYYELTYEWVNVFLSLLCGSSVPLVYILVPIWNEWILSPWGIIWGKKIRVPRFQLVTKILSISPPLGLIAPYSHLSDEYCFMMFSISVKVPTLLHDLPHEWNKSIFTPPSVWIFRLSWVLSKILNF